MIEKIKNNWKIILIFLLIAVIVFVLYKYGKQTLEVEPPQKNNAVGKSDIVEEQELNTRNSREPYNLDSIFADYRSGTISRKEALKYSKLSNGAFYRKLNKYDQVNAVQGDCDNV